MTDDDEERMSPSEAMFIEDLMEKADEMDVDPDRSTKEEDGWFRIYIECPDCEVPMARTAVEMDAEPENDLGVEVTESEFRAVCPECHEVASILELTRKTGPFDVLFGHDASE